MKPMFGKTAVLGLGLLGGSMARAGKKAGILGEVAGYGRKDERLRYAMENGIADSVHKDAVEAVKDADLVVISTPVGIIPNMMDTIAAHLKPGCLVTDLGSTKKKIVEHAEKTFPDNVFFVGCHPMAGSEESGVEASIETLFENAICALTPSNATHLDAVRRMEKFWRTLKAKVFIVSPAEHDMLVAASSHLPHMVAVALTRCISGVSDDNEKVLPLLAGGFRDTTRIASGSPEMWRDICLENRESISRMLDNFSSEISKTSELVKRGDPEELAEHLGAAKFFRDELPTRGRGILEPINEIFVVVTDKPGIIGEITTALGANGINLRNINVQHVRELKGGTLSLIIEKAEDMDRAVEVLTERGFTAKTRD